MQYDNLLKKLITEFDTIGLYATDITIICLPFKWTGYWASF